MEKAELERQFFFKMTKRFLIVNIILCFLDLILTILILPFHFIFLVLFDIFFLITIFLLVKDNMPYLLKKLILFFILYALFVWLSILIGISAFIALSSPFHYIFLLINTILIYIASLFSRKRHNFITILVIIFSLIVSFCMIGWIFYFIYLLWARFPH